MGGNSVLMMFGWNLCSALGLKFICKHNIFSYSTATKSNTERNPIEACRWLFKLHLKFCFKMSSLHCLAGSSSHCQFTSPASLKELKKQSVRCQIHSENCWSGLILHAVSIKWDCVRTSKIHNQNQFYIALFWYASNLQLHEKAIICSMSSWSNRY